MFVARIGGLNGLLIALSFSGPAIPDETTESNSPAEVKLFSEPTLLHRFDQNDDGKLNANERQTLRRAFGGVDVPMLPANPYRYTLSSTNLIDASRLQPLDNTPDDNPITDAGATLGRVLFYDRQLSQNNTIACASCHHQQHGFADPRQFSEGFAGGHTARNAMGLANPRFTVIRGNAPGFFWDERAPTLEAQVLMPIQDHVEMGMELDQLEAKLQKLPYYPGLFQAAFGSTQVNRQRIAMAVAQFMRSMVSFNAKFDRAATAASGDYSEDFDDFTAEENLGKSLFIDGVDGIAEIGCALCHIPPTFSMAKSLNNGLDLRYKDQGLGTLGQPPNEPFTANNNGKFKAPSLRNIELTAPYMHDGRFKTLEEVIEHYSSGVHPHENLSLAFNEETAAGATSGFQFTARQKAALVAFLKTLTDHEFVADPKFSDPFVR